MLPVNNYIFHECNSETSLNPNKLMSTNLNQNNFPITTYHEKKNSILKTNKCNMRLLDQAHSLHAKKKYFSTYLSLINNLYI